MNYFVMRRVSDPDVIGFKNGVTQAEIDRSGFQDKDEYEKITRLLGSEEFWSCRKQIPGMEFDLQCVRLLPKAKLTDFLHFGPALMFCPFLVSERALEVLVKFVHYGVRLWPAQVIDRKSSYSYRLPFIESIPDEMIDFAKSTFSLGGLIGPKTVYTFSDAEEKKQFVNSHRLLQYEEIYLNNSFPDIVDFFTLSNAAMIVSERLKLAIEKANLTGVQFLAEEGPWVKVRLS
ncbi:hypothetical protein KY495_06600 [Massilia sp. PAMC28688]|uniref:hypothetical protein n=1 Tax=Massilia sp. PAMC28688 TaxID=2861283 RepID=UPI001C629198|nr:hypothetical protein [Massilia sp. PAMC28688]QYF94849.1 hypothetical protein KY495_06600 [Massilia sp. PAMC28688]